MGKARRSPRRGSPLVERRLRLIESGRAFPANRLGGAGRPRSCWERRLPSRRGTKSPLRREASMRGLRPRAGAPSAISFVDEGLRRGLKPTRAGWKPALPARYARWRSPLGTWGLSEGAGDRLRPLSTASRGCRRIERYASPGGPADHHEPRPQKAAVAKTSTYRSQATIRPRKTPSLSVWFDLTC